MSLSLLETDSGDDGEVRHKRFDYPAPSLTGIFDFFASRTDITDVQAGILLNKTPQEVSQFKKHIRSVLRYPCPWTAPHDLLEDDGNVLCPKGNAPLGWMMPSGRQGELFRHLVVPPIVQLYPHLFREPDLETQIGQVKPNNFGRFEYAPFVVCREVLRRMIELCAAEMRANPCLRETDTEDQYISPPPRLKRFRAAEAEEESEDAPSKKKQILASFHFADVKAIATPPRAPLGLDISVKALSNDNVLSKAVVPLCDGPRSPSTVSELIEQEESKQLIQSSSSSALSSRNKYSTNDTPKKEPASSNTPDHRRLFNRLEQRKLLTAAASADTSPSSRGIARRDFDRFRGQDEHDMTSTSERRRLKISNITSKVSKKDIADFFHRHDVGYIFMTLRGDFGKRERTGFADFSTHRQAQRAIDDLNGTKLLDHVVTLEIAKMPLWLEEKQKSSRTLRQGSSLLPLAPIAPGAMEESWRCKETEARLREIRRDERHAENEGSEGSKSSKVTPYQ